MCTLTSQPNAIISPSSFGRKLEPLLLSVYFHLCAVVTGCRFKFCSNKMESFSGRQATVTVVIADSSRLGGQLMATALRRSRYRITVADTFSDSESVRFAFHKTRVNIDIALIASHLREGPLAGFQLLRELRASYPSTSFIALLDSSARAMVVEAFRAGANGILSREEPFERVCKCILSVHQGDIWASSRELKYALEALVQTDIPIPNPGRAERGRLFLTKREQGVVQLVSEGLTNRDISRQLNLSENTVRNYIFRIFNKVGTSNRLELALYAIDRRHNPHPESRD